MQIGDFRSIISTFSDPGTQLLTDKSRLLVSVNGEVIEASLVAKSGDLFVDDGAGEMSASSWILKRLAKMPLLASRLRDFVGDTPMFVSPSACLMPSLAVRPDDTPELTEDALGAMLDAIGANSPLETTVLYITSDAGEGKTFLINEMAKEQARRYISNDSDWLLVPIPLGGKHFMRFDDITVGALQNRYRFQSLYYDSFLALVRMGVIVPAFDGFEEMFVESSSGEALSAMGILVSALDSQGSLVIAARRAYFEFENLRTQEKLFDTISSYSVGFGKLELKRWSRKQFLAYCQRRQVINGEDIYSRVAERLGHEHSLLTRPVLVRRLVDIATQSPTLDEFLLGIHASGTDFFSVFVRGIIEREANEKWIDRTGDREVGAPLLTVDEHCKLLSGIALATWESNVDFLKRDHLEFVADFFCESSQKSAPQTQQIRERIRGHALLIASPNAANSVEFDHEEFRLFFLGEGIAEAVQPLNDRARGEVLTILRRGILPKLAQKSFIQSVKRHPTFERLEAARFLIGVSALDSLSSFTHENCSWLIVRLLSEVDARELEITGQVFSLDALRERKLTNIVFKRCIFASTSMELTKLVGCRFEHCSFSQIRLYESTHFSDVTFLQTSVDSLRMVDADIEVWEPSAVVGALTQLGVSHVGGAVAESALPIESKVDEELRDVEKLMRYFMRSTHISESVVMIKLGNHAQNFIDSTLPSLLEHGVMVEIDNRGGSQRRFKFGRSLEVLNEALHAARGSYLKFLEECDQRG